MNKNEFYRRMKIFFILLKERYYYQKNINLSQIIFQKNRHIFPLSQYKNRRNWQMFTNIFGKHNKNHAYILFTIKTQKLTKHFTRFI